MQRASSGEAASTPSPSLAFEVAPLLSQLSLTNPILPVANISPEEEQDEADEEEENSKRTDTATPSKSSRRRQRRKKQRNILPAHLPLGFRPKPGLSSQKPVSPSVVSSSKPASQLCAPAILAAASVPNASFISSNFGSIAAQFWETLAQFNKAQLGMQASYYQVYRYLQILYKLRNPI
jgi:hypothetical protein